MEETPTHEELSRLRRGHGLQGERLHAVEFPRLRAISGITDSDPPRVVREKLIEFLVKQIAKLPPLHQMAARAALAIHEEANDRFLQVRLDWLAKQVDRYSGKTARRIVHSAFAELAGIIDQGAQGGSELDRSDYSPAGWRVEELEAFVDLSGDRARLTEARTIVATLDQVDEILLSISVPQVGSAIPTIDVRILSGGELVEELPREGGHARFIMRLPEPLDLGEQHRYEVEFITLPSNEVTPYYVLLPLRDIERFAATIRFCVPPAQMWLLEGVPPIVLETRKQGNSSLKVNDAHEVSFEFRDLKEGRGYGVAWT